MKNQYPLHLHSISNLTCIQSTPDDHIYHFCHNKCPFFVQKLRDSWTLNLAFFAKIHESWIFDHADFDHDPRNITFNLCWLFPEIIILHSNVHPTKHRSLTMILRTQYLKHKTLSINPDIPVLKVMIHHQRSVIQPQITNSIISMISEWRKYRQKYMKRLSMKDRNFRIFSYK